jgi:formate C-acetyltransferase
MVDMQVPVLTAAQRAALNAAGEYYAAGFMAGASLSLPERYANALVNVYARRPLPAYAGERLFPLSATFPIRPAAGEPEPYFNDFYVCPSIYPPDAHAARLAATTDPDTRAAFAALADLCARLPQTHGWTHSTLQYERILAEGITGYRARIDAALAATADPDAAALYRGLQTLCDGITALCARITAHLDTARGDTPEAEARRQRLLTAYRAGAVVQSARGFFDALLTVALIFALDTYDSPGRFDQYLHPYYERSLAAGELDADEARALIADFWGLVDATNAWNVALGGSTRDGRETANALTVLCLEAARGRRRPNLALRLRRDTPEAVWDAALDNLRAGGGLPALYSEENYQHAMADAHLGLTPEDARDLAFGGCTELMIQGASNVGSLDGDINLAKLLDVTLPDALLTADSFDDVYAAVLRAYRAEVYRFTGVVNEWQRLRGAYYPQMLRTLFTDDCIARGRNFQDGGARYNWSVINIAGMSNVIDALAAVRETVFETREVPAAQLVAALHADFAGFEGLRARLRACPRFGNDHPAVDALAHRLSGDVFDELQRYAPWRGGKFIAGTLMFVTYGWMGAPVGATPDGRGAGEPISDSAGPVQGRDTHGPTAMLRSVTRLQQHRAPGTLVVNARFNASLFDTPEGRAQLKAMIRAYFQLGGMQLQVNVVDQAVLRDAIAHPEQHADLVVRMGGYSEYFTRLDPKLQATVLERTEHAG